MKLNDLKIKPKKCKQCLELFAPSRPLQMVCGAPCAIAYGNKQKARKAADEAKKSKRETKEKLAKIKPRQEHLREAQRFFNQYIRLRDEHLPCISCQRFHTGQYHAGHFRSVGSSPHLRFSEHNVHKQCSACNNHLSGNILNFRINLIRKIGLEAVEAIENDNTAKHYTIEEIQAIKVKYKQLTKQLLEKGITE
jgi:hypothetical protein